MKPTQENILNSDEKFFKEIQFEYNFLFLSLNFFFVRLKSNKNKHELLYFIMNIFILPMLMSLCALKRVTVALCSMKCSNFATKYIKILGV